MIAITIWMIAAAFWISALADAAVTSVFDAHLGLRESDSRCLSNTISFVNSSVCVAAETEPQLLNGDEAVSFHQQSSSGSSDRFSTSEASLKASSPAPIEADQLGSDLGEPQVMDINQQDAIVSLIANAREYVHKTVLVNETYS